MKKQAFLRPATQDCTRFVKRTGAMPFGLEVESLSTCTSAFLKYPDLVDVAGRVLGSTLQQGTITGYEGVIRDFNNFTEGQGYIREPTKVSVSHFLLYLEKQIVSNSYISKVKAALVMYEDMLRMNSTSLTQHVLRILDRVKNLAVNRKSPV